MRVPVVVQLGGQPRYVKRVQQETPTQHRHHHSSPKHLRHHRPRPGTVLENVKRDFRH
jgi:hypothetical protein